MRSRYDQAVAAERARNAPRDPRSGTYGRGAAGLPARISRELQQHPAASLAATALIAAAVTALVVTTRRRRRQ
jgi:hypothetical protein